MRVDTNFSEDCFPAQAEKTLAPARFRRRKVPFGRDCCENPPSGENSAPEGGFGTGSRRKPSLRRLFLAGGRVSAATAYAIGLPASFSRRKGTFVRDCRGNPSFGAVSSPEGAFAQEVRTKPLLWRHLLARRRIYAAAEYVAFAPASSRRRPAARPFSFLLAPSTGVWHATKPTQTGRMSAYVWCAVSQGIPQGSVAGEGTQDESSGHRPRRACCRGNLGRG